MRKRSWELITADESSVVAKPFLDAIVVEDGKSDRGFPDPPSTDESDGFKVFSEPDNPFNKLVAPEKCPRRWGGSSPTRVL